MFRLFSHVRLRIQVWAANFMICIFLVTSVSCVCCPFVQKCDFGSNLQGFEEVCCQSVFWRGPGVEKDRILDHRDLRKQANGWRVSAVYKKSPSWRPDRFWSHFGSLLGPLWEAFGIILDHMGSIWALLGSSGEGNEDFKRISRQGRLPGSPKGPF